MLVCVASFVSATPAISLNCGDVVAGAEVSCNVVSSESLTISSIQFDVSSSWPVKSGTCPSGATTEFFQGRLVCTMENDITTTSFGTITLTAPDSSGSTTVTLSGVDVTDSNFASVDFSSVGSATLSVQAAAPTVPNCGPYDWQTTWSECSGDCGPGTQTSSYTKKIDCQGTAPASTTRNCQNAAACEQEPTTCPEGQELVGGECVGVTNTLMQSIKDILNNKNYDKLQKISALAKALREHFK